MGMAAIEVVKRLGALLVSAWIVLAVIGALSFVSSWLAGGLAVVLLVAGTQAVARMARSSWAFVGERGRDDRCMVPGCLGHLEVTVVSSGGEYIGRLCRTHGKRLEEARTVDGRVRVGENTGTGLSGVPRVREDLLDGDDGRRVAGAEPGSPDLLDVRAPSSERL